MINLKQTGDYNADELIVAVEALTSAGIQLGEIIPAKAEAVQSNDLEVIATAGKLLALFNYGTTRNVDYIGADVGPRIIRYKFRPVKPGAIRDVLHCIDEVTLNFGNGVMIEALTPGDGAVAVEIPRKNPQEVRLIDLMESEEFRNSPSRTLACIGKAATGEPVFCDIAKAPHLLIAGAVGMGKSVCVNDILVSLLQRATPDELRLILIDPKKVELREYDNIPHLLMPVVTDIGKAVNALTWACEEMDRRYRRLSDLAVRDINSYNERVKSDPTLGEPMAKIVIVIDELCDLMMTAREKAEELIARIAMKSRAAGIHMIICTQRPSVNVLTGVIKANIPSRLCCRVASAVDSRAVLEQGGAERLLGCGDAFFITIGRNAPIRVQCAYIGDESVKNAMKALRDKECAKEKCAPTPATALTNTEKCAAEAPEKMLSDEAFVEAVKIAVNDGRISTSLLQRKLSIGYSRAAKYIDCMTGLGLISEPDGVKPRTILPAAAEWLTEHTK